MSTVDLGLVGSYDPIPKGAPSVALMSVVDGRSLSQEDVTVHAAYAYDRKGYESYDGLGRPRNPAYSGTHDDIVVVVTVRIPSYHPDYDSLVELGEQLAVDAEAAKVAAAQAEVAAAQAKLDQARERLDQARNRR